MHQILDHLLEKLFGRLIRSDKIIKKKFKYLK